MRARTLRAYRAEDAMYDLFNRINTGDQYDIHRLHELNAELETSAEPD